MPSLVERVAARHRLAAFIPDKFFKGYEAELKKLLATSLRGKPLEEVPWLIREEVVPLFKRFTKELIELAPQAEATLTSRLETRVTMLEKLGTAYSDSRRAIEAPYPMTTTLDHVLLHIQVMVDGSLEKLLPTLGKAFRIQVAIDAAQVKALAERGLKKATPAERAAIDADQDWSNETLRVKYEFYQKHIDRSVPRLIKKQKVSHSFTEWFAFIREMLAANYVREPKYSQFDLHGMKVVIDDVTVTPEEHDKFVKYLDVAYQRLKKKKLERAWYGTVFFQCEECGGPSESGKYDIAGHYFRGPDTVRIYTRPSSWTTHVMVHELGHRYWFKSMSQSQRAKFESLVKVYEGPAPTSAAKLISEEEVNRTSRTIQERKEDISSVLNKFKRSPAKDIKANAEQFEEPLKKAEWDFSTIKMDAQIGTGPGLKHPYDEMLESLKTLQHHMHSSKELVGDLPNVIDGDKLYEKARGRWVEEAESLVEAAVTKARAYMTQAAKVHNEREMAKLTDAERERQKAWDTDTREVTPVSNYGKTNTAEAFAEAFAHYVLEHTMTAEQEASFKAVLLKKDRMASRVAARWGASV